MSTATGAHKPMKYIDAIKARVKAATPGPWDASYNNVRSEHSDLMSKLVAAAAYVIVALKRWLRKRY